MNRRAFLGLLGAGAAGLAAEFALDPERALWTPGRKTFFEVRQPKAKCTAITLAEPKSFIGVLHIGDVITVEGQYRRKGHLQEFVVTGVSENEAIVRVAPPIVKTFRGAPHTPVLLQAHGGKWGVAT